MNKLLQGWVGNNLPTIHVRLKFGVKNLILDLIIHPIKRRIAKYYLIFLRKFFDLKVVGITGSSGKTTTKEMLASILKLKGKTVFSYANIDPVYNIPTTILKCTPWTKYLVLEMGVEYPGEMDFYLWLAKPDIGVITNIHNTHTQFFGDIEGVLTEKSKLIQKLTLKDIAVLNKEDLRLREAANKTTAKILWFGERGDIKAKAVNLTESGNSEFILIIGTQKIPVTIPILGQQFVNDALAAVAVAVALKISPLIIKKGLSEFEKSPHRMEVINHVSGAIIIDDSYNSNPSALKETLKTFMFIGRRKNKILILGDMLELGKLKEESHQEIGRIVSSLGIGYLICVGNAAVIIAKEAQKKMGKNRVKFFNTPKSAAHLASKFLDKGNIILVKASRSIGLDKLVHELNKGI